MKRHKWWHFFYGKETKSKVVYKAKSFTTSNYWEVCKKCGVQTSEKRGYTTYAFDIFISN